MQNDTIAAIATAMSPSGIGIIRISGDDALSVIDRIYKSKNNKKKISACQSHTIHYGFIYRGDFEKRIKMVMEGAVKEGNTIIYIDEIHNMIGAGSVTAGPAGAYSGMYQQQ